MFPWNQGEDGPTLKYAENTIYGDIRGGYTFALMQNGMNYDISLKQVIMLFHPKERLFFYSVGSRLQAYDYNPGHERVQDLGDWGGEIIMLKFNIQGCYEESVRPWTAHKETINDLYIATYNTPDGGRLRKLTVGINPDVIEVASDPKADWTGLGKIVNMDWRNDQEVEYYLGFRDGAFVPESVKKEDRRKIFCISNLLLGFPFSTFCCNFVFI